MSLNNNDVKQWIKNLRYIEETGLSNHLSSYDVGNLANLIEEQDCIINDLMFENESKQNRIVNLFTELQQIKNERNKLMSELATENSCDYCVHHPDGIGCELSGTKNLIVLNGFCHSWKWHGL